MPPDLIFLAIVLICSGVVAGLMAGLLGIGGGIVMVPVLYVAFGLIGVPGSAHMHLAVGTSLAIIVPTAISSARSHHKRGAVHLETVRYWGPSLVLGSLLGAAIAGYLESSALTLFFAVMALIIGVKLILPLDDRRLGHTLPSGMPGRGIPLAIGTFSSLMGIGGASFSVPTFTLFSWPIHRAIGTASLLGLLISVPASLGYVVSGWGVTDLPPLSLGYVNLLALGLVAPASTLMAPVGARLSHALSRRVLSVCFGVFLLVTAMRLFSEVL